jgi:hypothetical protein
MTLGSNTFSIVALSILTTNIKTLCSSTISIIALSMTVRYVLLSDALKPNMKSAVMLIDNMLSVMASLRGLLKFYSDQSYKRIHN